LIQSASALQSTQTLPLKPKVREEIYTASNDFGKNFAALVKNYLKEKGY